MQLLFITYKYFIHKYITVGVFSKNEFQPGSSNVLEKYQVLRDFCSNRNCKLLFL